MTRINIKFGPRILQIEYTKTEDYVRTVGTIVCYFALITAALITWYAPVLLPPACPAQANVELWKFDLVISSYSKQESLADDGACQLGRSNPSKQVEGHMKNKCQTPSVITVEQSHGRLLLISELKSGGLANCGKMWQVRRQAAHKWQRARLCLYDITNNIFSLQHHALR